MATESLVEPKETAPAEETPITESSGEQGAALSDEVLRLPVVQALTIGEPPAVSADIVAFSKTPEAKIIAQNKKSLMSAGFGFYRSLDGQFGTMFNQLFITGEDVKKADQAGALLEIAPLESDVKTVLQTAGQEQQAAVPPAPIASPTAAPANRKVMEERVTNMAPGSPLQGPRPGAGQILSSILKPVL